MTENILLTGCTSFLGAAIIDCLVKDGYNIFGSNIVNYSIENKHIMFIIPNSNDCDCLNFDKLNNYINEFKITKIFHAAARCGGIGLNQKTPADLTVENIQMGINVYMAAKLNNIEYVYTLGSVCAYPQFCDIPFKESDLWNGMPEITNAGYGHAKRTLLMLGNTYRSQYGIKGGQLIPINMYGLQDHYDLENSHVIPALIRKIYEAKLNKDKDVTCWGSGKAYRSFLNSHDCAQAIVKTCLLNLDFEQPINLGPTDDISIKDLSLLISKLINYNGNIVFDPSKPDGQLRRLLDTSRAKDILDWQAQIKFEKGLNDTIKWYIANRELLINNESKKIRR